MQVKSFTSWIVLVLLSCLTTFNAHASGIKILTTEPSQGSMIVGQLLVDGDVYFEQKQLKVSPGGIFVFGVGRDAASSVELLLKQKNSEVKFPINIRQREWQIERVDGLPPGKVNPKSEEVLARIRQEGGLVKSARSKETEYSFFQEDFILPAEGRISGVYGSQRILNGEPKRPHFGLDIANKTGQPVVAPASGIVSLVHKDMFYSGGTLIIDHGYGISSTYIHLNSISVKVGEMVKQGQEIATIGATGRATGPHLDWRLNWFNTRLDPQLLIKTSKGE